MGWKKSLIFVSFAGFVFLGGAALADCPSADLTGDCFVDFKDFAVMTNQWLTGDPNIPDDIVYIMDGGFEMGDHFAEGGLDELPLHPVLLDSFFMSKFEITNQQYCDYLNSAYDACDTKVDGGVVYDFNDTGNSYPYCNTHSYDTDSQIDYNDVTGTFSVRTKGGRDMSDDPMVEVSWYGAAAYCNWRSAQEGYQQLYDACDPNWPCDFSKHGYRLPTEAEWEYAARGGENSPYYRFPWGDTISNSQANYFASPSFYTYDVSPTSGFHPLWNGVNPKTSPVGFFDGTMKYKADYNWPGSDTSYQTISGANGYGLYDMSGNVWEWCNDWHIGDYYDTSPYDNPTGPASGTFRVLRGGGWDVGPVDCRVVFRHVIYPSGRSFIVGFRIVLDSN